MPRTTEAAVQAIIEVDASISLTPFIEVANNMVTRVCTDSDYDDDTLELIERWLAAHFYAIRDMRSANEKAGSVGQAFQYRVDLNLANTMYGQQAMMIDTEGSLREVSDGKPRRATMTWLGKEDQYEDVDDDED